MMQGYGRQSNRELLQLSLREVAEVWGLERALQCQYRIDRLHRFEDSVKASD